MAKFNESTAWTALTAPVATDWLLVCDASADVVKIMDISYLLVALDGDHLDIDFTPTYYTPATTPAEADDVDDLAAHLYGIDQKLGEIDLEPIEQADTTFTVSSTGHYIEIDTSGNPVTATLPSAATLGAGWKYVFKVTDATNVVTVSTNGAETINGAAGWKFSFKNEIFELISDGTNWKTLRWKIPQETRSIFSYNDATSYKASSGIYDLPTSAFGKVYWKGTLTLGPSTWAAGSTAITTTGWHYLYLDQSAIDASSSPIVEDSHFLSSTTAPTYSTTYQGLYNGNDRCIFAVRFSAASTLVEFFHDGGEFVLFADAVYDYTSADVDTVWTDVTLSIPKFDSNYTCSAQVFFWADQIPNNVDHTLMWRTNGQTGATGHPACKIMTSNSGTADRINTMRVIGDGNAIIEVRYDTTNSAQIGVYTDGFYLPKGL